MMYPRGMSYRCQEDEGDIIDNKAQNPRSPRRKKNIKCFNAFPTKNNHHPRTFSSLHEIIKHPTSFINNSSSPSSQMLSKSQIAAVVYLISSVTVSSLLISALCSQSWYTQSHSEDLFDETEKFGPLLYQSCNDEDGCHFIYSYYDEIPGWEDSMEEKEILFEVGICVAFLFCLDIVLMLFGTFCMLTQHNSYASKNFQSFNKNFLVQRSYWLVLFSNLLFHAVTVGLWARLFPLYDSGYKTSIGPGIEIMIAAAGVSLIGGAVNVVLCRKSVSAYSNVV